MHYLSPSLEFRGDASIAAQALLRIAQLYRIEEKMRSKSAEERCAVRRAQSVPHFEALKSFFEKQLGRVSGKSPIAKAIRYGLLALRRIDPLPQ